MAINLMALNAKEITTFTRSQIEPATYRLNTDKIKENWDKLKANSQDLVEISTSLDIEGLDISGGLKRTGCNYSLDAFFRTDMPQITTDGGYQVGGVYFSKEELEQCRMVMKTATDNMTCGIGRNANLDYENYAQMGIAAGTVKKYAAENLTEEQAAVVNKAMQEYNEALVNMEQDMMSDGTYLDSPYEGLNEYYGKVHLLNDSEIEAINNLKKELGKLTGRYYEPTTSGAISVVQTATNKELIGNITDLFSNLDYSDEEAVNKAMEQYKRWMTPAYTAAGMNDLHGSLTRVLNEDVAGFRKQIENVLMASNYHEAEYRV